MSGSFLSRRNASIDPTVRNALFESRALQRDEQSDITFGASSSSSLSSSLSPAVPVVTLDGSRNSKAVSSGRDLSNNAVSSLFQPTNIYSKTDETLNMNEVDLYIQFIKDVNRDGLDLLVKNSTTISSLQKCFPSNAFLPKDSPIHMFLNMSNAFVYLKWLCEKGYESTSLESIHIPAIKRLVKAANNNREFTSSEDAQFRAVFRDCRKNICSVKSSNARGAKPLLTTFVEDIIGAMPRRDPHFISESCLFSVSQGIGSRCITLSNMRFDDIFCVTASESEGKHLVGLASRVLKGETESSHSNIFEGKINCSTVDEEKNNQVYRLNRLILQASNGRYSFDNWALPVESSIIDSPSNVSTDWLDNLTTRKSNPVINGTSNSKSDDFEDEDMVSKSSANTPSSFNTYCHEEYATPVTFDALNPEYVGWGQSSKPSHIFFRSQFLWNLSPDSMSMRLKKRAFQAGYYQIRSDGTKSALFSMHAGRSGQIVSSIISSGMANDGSFNSNNVADAVSRSAMICNWRPQGKSIGFYLKNVLSRSIVANRTQSMDTSTTTSTSTSSAISTAMLDPAHFIGVKRQPISFDYDAINAKYFGHYMDSEFMTFNNSINGTKLNSDNRFKVSYLWKANRLMNKFLQSFESTKSYIKQAMNKLIEEEEEDDIDIEQRPRRATCRLSIAVSKSVGHLITECGDDIIEKIRLGVLSDTSILSLINQVYAWEAPDTKPCSSVNTTLNGGGRGNRPTVVSKSSSCGIPSLKGTISTDGVRSFPKSCGVSTATKRYRWTDEEDAVLFKGVMQGLKNRCIARSLERRNNGDCKSRIINLTRKYPKCWSYSSPLAKWLGISKPTEEKLERPVRTTETLPSSSLYDDVVLRIDKSGKDVIDIDSDDNEEKGKDVKCYYDGVSDANSDKDDEDYDDDEESDEESEDFDSEDESEDFESEEESEDEEEPESKKRRVQAVPPLPLVSSTSIQQQITQVTSILKAKTQTKQATLRRKWTVEETDALLECLNLYGRSWEKMLHSEEGALLLSANRTGQMLKDKLVTMKKNGAVGWMIF